MKLKGQTIVFEQVLLFTIGIVVLISSFSLFVMYQNYYTSATNADHIAEVKEYVLSSIMKLSENREFNSSAIVKIPQTINNEYYRISLTNDGLNISLTTSKMNDFSRLYGLNKTFSFGGTVTSGRGKIVIYKRGDSIIIQ